MAAVAVATYLVPAPVRAAGFSPVMARPDPAELSESPTAGWRVGVRESSFVGNRILPLADLFGDWEGSARISSKNLAHLRSETAATARQGMWELSAGLRTELTMEANRDAVEIIRLLRGKQDLPTDAVFETALSGNGFAAEQVRLARGWTSDSFPGLSAGAAIAFLHGELVQKGRVGGPLTVTGRRAYDYDLDLDYAYDQNYLYDREAGRGDLSGYGHAFDFGLGYRRGAARLFARVEDFASAIRWSNVPATQARAANGRRYFDESGYVHYDPIISGFEGDRSMTQGIAAKYSAGGSYDAGMIRIDVAADRMRNVTFPRIAVETPFPGRDDDRLSAGYDIYFQSASIRYAGRKGGLALMSDALVPRRVRSAGLEVSYIW